METPQLPLYRRFGAEERYRLTDPDTGKIGLCADLKIGSGGIMLADEHRDFGALSPPTIGGTPVLLHITC